MSEVSVSSSAPAPSSNESSAPAVNKSPAPEAKPQTLEEKKAAFAKSEPKESEPKEKKDPEPKEKAEAKPAESEEKKEVKEEKQEEKVAEAKRKLKLKIQGQEREYDEDEVIRRAQLSETAEARFQQAAEVQQQMKNFVDALRNNPMDVLTQLGLGDKLDELAEQRLTKKVQQELMSPEERELAELREFREKHTREQEENTTRSKKEAEDTQMREYQQRATQHYDTQISDALNKSNLPKTAYTVKRVAEVMASALDKGYDIDAQTAVDMVREGYMTDINQMFGSMEAEGLLGMLGDGLAKKIRQYDIGRLKAKINPPQQAATPAEQVEQTMQSKPAPQRKQQEQFLKPNEWAEMIRKKAGL